ncbi:hypothetical protein JNUCC1_01732 [Lentibacillus sp. JNUCC-1]|uniref:DUF1189 family protein n=1 Tax=Lentibacillus sp. JNUCC-1 TaxID=2654513 RepID=UPI0013220E5A|nr:DUF1189 family protein [Lentibacillus sp. JNUCC-1]MUV37926.1 hypothetical protein [Lentibacillus sp. JNUCC-1]
MVLWHTFIHSLKLPSKQAMFKLNRTGMDMAVIYMLILIFLSSIPTAVHMLTSGTNEAGINIAFWLVYFFFIFYLPITVVVFLALTLLAYIGTLIAKLLNRKLKLSLLWKMSAYASTIPALAYTLYAFIFPLNLYIMWLMIAFIMIYLVKMITVYPKRKIKKPHPSHDR